MGLKLKNNKDLSRQESESSMMTPNLDRGLSVLELLGKHPNGLIASEIADSLEIPRNSMGRILATFVDRGYLSLDDKSKAFKLTRKLLSIGSSIVCELNLVEVALDAMRELRDSVSGTVLLSTLVDGQGVNLEQMLARQSVRLSIEPGSRFDLHCTAPGKLHLGYLPVNERKRLLASLKLKRYTATTIVSKEELMKEVEESVRRGYAVDRSEGIYGSHCVSAPIFDRNGICVAALTVTGFVESLPEEDFPLLAEIIKAHALKISKRLGFDSVDKS